MSRSGVSEAVRAAVGTVGLPSCTVARRSSTVHALDVTAGLAYEPDLAEVARRVSVGLGPITRLDVLDALMGLPIGLPVATGDLSARERLLVRDAPPGAVDVQGGYLIRRATRPLTPRFAVVAAEEWRQGLVRAGRFAPFCARAVLLPVAPDDLDDARVEATFYGIGLCVFVDGQLRMLVDPEPYVAQRHSAGKWWLAEEVFGQVPTVGSAV